MLEFTSQTLI